MKAIKKSEERAKNFIVAVPERMDEVVLTVSASGKPQYGFDKTIFWLRARELGSEVWSQTVWAEVDEQEDGFFVSKDIPTRGLWLVPETTYEIEVVPETMEVDDFDLHVEIKVKVEGDRLVEKPKMPGAKESVLDNPFIWAVLMAGTLIGFLIMKAQ